MKRYVFILLTVFLFLSFTALAYAEADVTVGGRILVRGWYVQNLGSFMGIPAYTAGVPVDTNSDAFYTTNAYIYIDGKINDNVQGYMELETAGGENPQSGLYIWGANSDARQNYDAKPNADLRFRQAWILYKGSGLLGVPAGVKVGHQLLTLGEKQFLNHERFGDDAVVAFVEPTKDLFIAALTAKLNEGSYQSSGDDIDAYAILGTYKINPDNTVGLYYFYADCDDLQEAVGYAGLDALSLQDFGGHANGKIAGITYAGEFDVQFGRAERQEGTPVSTLDYSGYALYGRAGYAINSFNIRASAAYGSGDNDLEDDKIEEFQTSQGFDTENAIARFTHYTQIYEQTVSTAALIQTVGGSGFIVAPHRNTGIANTTYVNVGADWGVTKDLNLSLDGFYLWASETNGWEDLVGNSVSDTIGWEIDAKASYKLAKNLTYFVEAATFNPGSFYDDVYGITGKTVNRVVHGLNLTF